MVRCERVMAVSSTDLIHQLLSGRSAATRDAFNRKLREATLKYYDENALLIISWNKLTTPDPALVLKPIAKLTSTVLVRYSTKVLVLDVLISLPITKNELGSYQNRIVEREILPVTEYINVTAKIWNNSQQLRSRALNFEDLDLLSVFTGELIRSGIRIDNSINLALALKDTKPYGSIREVMREQFAYARGSEAFDSMDVTDIREEFVEYVEKHRQVSVYSEEYPLKILELPVGVGFVDLLEKKYIIEPFLAIVTDTVDRPLNMHQIKIDRRVSMSEVDKSFPLSLGARNSTSFVQSPVLETGDLKPRSSSAIQNYYVLRKSSREQVLREALPEFMSIGCYATKTIFFGSASDAQIAIDLLYKHRGRSKIRDQRLDAAKQDMSISIVPAIKDHLVDG